MMKTSMKLADGNMWNMDIQSDMYTILSSIVHTSMQSHLNMAVYKTGNYMQ